MFTLIKREIESLAILMLLALIVVVFFLVIIANQVVRDYPRNIPLGVPMIMINLFVVPVMIMPILSAVAGLVQSSLDSSQKKSAFLTTLALTRNQIVTARLAGGGVFIMVQLVPLVVGYAVLLALYPPVVPIDVSMFAGVFITSLIFNTAAYFIGLLTGTAGRAIYRLVFCGLILIFIFFIIIAKGFGPDAWLLLLIVTIAAAYKYWSSFLRMAL